MYTHLRYGIYRGAMPDIELLNLRFLNGRMYSISSPEFATFARNLNRSSQINFYNEIKSILREHIQPGQELYAFIPVKKSQPIEEKTFHELVQILLILFPSDFHLICIAVMGRQEGERGFKNAHYLTFNYIVQRLSNPGGNHLSLTMDGTIRDINKIIRLFFHRYDQMEYLSLFIHYYHFSFSHVNILMTYINLFMAFEALSDGTSELTHRLARMSAVINASTNEEGWTIYKNFSKFYKLRSAIVHGSNLQKYERKIKECYFPIQSLLSRTLIELIQQGFESKEQMNNIVVESSFGSKHKLRSGYKNYLINLHVSHLATTLV